MIGALIRKDLRLLRIYLRSFVAAIAFFFAFSAGFNLVLAWKGNELVEDSKMLVTSILAGGSMCGILIVIPVFSSLLPASVLTLERSDRSSQFLACLPPTRMQIYLSKLIVVAVVVFFFFSLCLLPWFLANQLFHQIEIDELSRSKSVRTQLPLDYSAFFFVMVSMAFAKSWDHVSLIPFVACFASMIGGSLLASVWSKSNAVPTLCGVLTPIAIVLVLVRVKILLNLDLPEDPWVEVYCLVSCGVSLCCINACGYVFCRQREY